MTTADFSRLVVKHEDVLHPYAITLTRNNEDAKDLYQETMLRALQYRDKYQFGTNLKAWLYTIMRNTFINSYRRNKKLRDIQQETIELSKPDAIAHNAGIGKVRLKEIKEKIEQLPEAFRISFELYYTGYKYQEIADLLDEPMGTIKSRIHIARKQLVQQIER
jgi:RNA polymerase sigma-70 factor (ECF subfamily)